MALQCPGIWYSPTRQWTSVRESIVNAAKAGILACNVFTALPTILAVDFEGKNLGVTYSCGTARELHTIPYYLRKAKPFCLMRSKQSTIS